MLRMITAQQFIEWHAYSRLDPFDETRGDLRAAQISQMIWAVNRGKGVKVPDLKDFTLAFDAQPRRRQTWQEQKMIGQMLADIYAGTK